MSGSPMASRCSLASTCLFRYAGGEVSVCVSEGRLGRQTWKRRSCSEVKVRVRSTATPDVREPIAS